MRRSRFYMLFAIGLKGGVALKDSSIVQLAEPIFATLAISLLTPTIAHNVCQKFGKLDRTNAAAMAAHCGSVSAVTFIAATTFAQAQGLKPEGFMPALVAVLEVPAILMALWLVLRKEKDRPLGPLLHELVTGRAIILLIGGLTIGLLATPSAMQHVQPLFGDIFKRALTVFLLLFGTLVPLINGALACSLVRRLVCTKAVPQLLEPWSRVHPI